MRIMFEGATPTFFRLKDATNYEVTVEIDDMGEIIYSECDCPYDFGPVCKHEVAVFFQLAEIINTGSVKWDTKEVPTKATRNRRGIEQSS